MIVEHCEMLVGGRRERGYTTNVDKVECHSLLALLCVVFSIPLILMERRWGMKWRGEREERLKFKVERGTKGEERTANRTEQNEDEILHRSWSPGTSDHVHR